MSTLMHFSEEMAGSCLNTQQKIFDVASYYLSVYQTEGMTYLVRHIQEMALKSHSGNDDDQHIWWYHNPRMFHILSSLVFLDMMELAESDLLLYETHPTPLEVFKTLTRNIGPLKPNPELSRSTLSFDDGQPNE